MRIYDKKCLFVPTLAYLLTACGGGGGGGSSNKASTISPVSSKPTTDVVAPTGPIWVDGKVEEKPKPIIPIFSKLEPSGGGSDYDPSGSSVDKERKTPSENPKPKPPEEVPPSPTELKPEIVVQPPVAENPNPEEVSPKSPEEVPLLPKVEPFIIKKSETINVEYKNGVGKGIFADKGGKAINNGNIIATVNDSTTEVVMMEANYGGTLENNGKLEGKGTIITGMISLSNGEGFTSTNNGEIEINGNKKPEADHGSFIGMKAEKIVRKDGVDEKIYLVNNGKITVNSNEFDIINQNKPHSIEGISIVTINSKSENIAENKKVISTSGKGALGMNASGENTFIINKGTVNVNGEKAIGMKASWGAIAINEKEGIINIQGLNSYGMAATSRGKVVNKGKIILEGDSPLMTGMYALHEGSSILNEGEIIFLNDGTGKRGILASNGATYINKGKILANGNLEISADKLGAFIVGKEGSGDISRVRAKRSLKIDGDIVASKDLIEDNKKEIIYKNVFSAPKIELARASDPKAVSMFYNSKLKLNNSGNVDMIISRNKTTIEKSYKSKEFNSLTNSLDIYLGIEKTKFSKDEKLVVDKILKSDNINEVQKVVKDLSGEIYANLPRQIFDIQDRFIKEDGKLIDNLNEYSYNFNFFGDKSSVKNKGEISGYKTRSEGFVGTKRFENDIYATIGYENSSVKYNEGSKGSIQSIHTGIYKKLLLNEFDIKLGLNGEYNFHETNREIDSFDKKAKGKYNSYTLGANSEISRVYGDSLYIKPTLGLNLGYGKYEKFTEKNAGDLGLTVKEESYFSVLPSVGFKVGKNFESVDIYSNAIYSYELGDLNKKQGMSLLGDKVNYKLNSDSLEKANLVLNAGVSTEIKDFKITFELGKEFGKRDNNYLALGIGYKF